MSNTTRKNTIVIFEYESLLIKNTIPFHIVDFLSKVKCVASIGIVSVNDIVSNNHNINLFDIFDYVFCQNGAVVYHNYTKISNKSFGNGVAHNIIDLATKYIAGLDVTKYGLSIHNHGAVININPIGRDFDGLRDMIDYLKKYVNAHYYIKDKSSINVSLFPHSYIYDITRDFEHLHHIGKHGTHQYLTDTPEEIIEKCAKLLGL